VQSYLEYLQGAFLIRRLPPFEANLRKRLVKSPRLYWRDSGLLHALLRLRPDDDLFAQPWVGASWEGFVIEQILAVRQARGEAFDAYFFRSHDGFEADLVLDFGREREVIEIKLTSGPSPEDLAGLGKVADMLQATRQVLLCRVAKSVTGGERWVAGLGDYLKACSP
jgi:predicted AAA+ superfamily ATPase